MTPAVLATTTASRVEASYRIRKPLTERVLDRLPGPRVAWFLGWGLLPFAAYEIAYYAWQLPTYSGLTGDLVIGFVNLFGLWAAGRLARRIEQLQPTLERLLPAGELGPQRHPFRYIGSFTGPLVLTTLFVLSWDVWNFLNFPGIATGSVLVAVFIGVFALSTFLWVYVSALFGLDRIGRRALRLEPFSTNPNLGLKPLGSLAFEAFLLAGVMLAPVFLAFTDLLTVVITLTIVAVVSVLFFLSAYTLHRQLVQAKASHVLWARQLVAASLAPIEASDAQPVDGPAIERTLAGVAPSLAVATELERRALAIQEWPFDATIIRTVVAILTSVTAVVIARLLLSRLGM